MNSNLVCKEVVIAGRIVQEIEKAHSSAPVGENGTPYRAYVIVSMGDKQVDVQGIINMGQEDEETYYHAVVSMGEDEEKIYWREKELIMKLASAFLEKSYFVSWKKDTSSTIWIFGEITLGENK